MFFVLLFIATAFLAITALLRGPRAAILAAFVLAMSLPCWIYTEAGAMRIDIRTMLAVVGIGCLTLHHQTKLQWQPIAADFVMVGLVGVQIASEYLTGNPTLTVSLDIAIQWLIPYSLGRLVVSSLDDERRLLPGIVWACLALSLWSAVESIMRINPPAALVGHVGSLQAMTDLRWGFRRAEGPHTHPIFFGLHLVLMLPFALQAARVARLGEGPTWWRWTPWCVAAGAFFTMSRGPQMGILMTLFTLVVVLAPHWRKVFIVPAVLTVLLLYGSGDMMIDLLEHWSGEKTRLTIMMNGEPVIYTGTTHRLLQVQVYSQALAEAGWFGYGTTPLSAEVNTVPFIEEHLRKMFSSIDNHYLQFGLQTGYLGLGLFLTLCLLGIVYSAAVVRRGAAEVHWLGAGMTGAFVALTLLMSSVWLASDYRFDLLAMLGYAGSLLPAAKRESQTVRASVRESASSLLSSLQLSPGHRLVPSA